ncbi:hypothetical protein RJ55_03299 [Drechmeria coniospora]|nr:hypothetical protein RJ55_03299 [Drechmeria coniospora]
MDAQTPMSVSSRFEQRESQDFTLSRHDDGFASKRISSRNTPFSIASFETIGTAPEVSEALVVHMYPHQNSSIVIVNQSKKSTEASGSTIDETQARELPASPPRITRTNPGGGMVTPPQQIASDEVDSPLRNPRPPPQPPTYPPTINFIPATPSGTTPAEERPAQPSPRRRPSIVRRALSRRRHSVDYPPTSTKLPGLLTRTLSLSKQGRYLLGATTAGGDGDVADFANREMAQFTDEDKLHPYWRPQWPKEEGDGDYKNHEHSFEDDVHLHTVVNNGSRMPKRSLSARMKRTFAIMPIRDDQYPVGNMPSPERRTIRRTPSGSLRVMRRRASADSTRRRASLLDGTSPSPVEGARYRFWQSQIVRRRPSQKRLRRFSISSRFEEMQNLPRVLSERRREKRSQQLRQMISGPKEVRHGVDEVIKTMSTKDQPYDSRALI